MPEQMTGVTIHTFASLAKNQGIIDTSLAHQWYIIGTILLEAPFIIELKDWRHQEPSRFFMLISQPHSDIGFQ